MSPTPVHVTGKRKSPSWPTPATDPEGVLSPKKRRRSLASVRASRLLARHRPALENLPTELLEMILLYSANLALPRSSPIIGSKLSAKATLLRLFVMAFHDTWDKWFGILRLQRQCQPANRRDMARYQGDVAFQARHGPPPPPFSLFFLFFPFFPLVPPLMFDSSPSTSSRPNLQNLLLQY